MSKKAHLAAAVLVPLWRGKRLLRFVSAGQRVLAYHAVGSRVPGDNLNLHSVTPAQFESHLEAIAAMGLRVGELGDPSADVAITFDDGYRDTLTTALPILDCFGFPFTVFVATGFAQSGEALYLRASDVKELASHPLASIGAHGESHHRLTGLRDEQLRRELTASRAWLEEVIGSGSGALKSDARITRMSYPHGAVDARVRDAVRAAGFEEAWTSVFGVNEGGGGRGGNRSSATSNPLMQKRIAVWSTDDASLLRQKLEGDWDWMGLYKSPR